MSIFGIDFLDLTFCNIEIQIFNRKILKFGGFLNLIVRLDTEKNNIWKHNRPLHVRKIIIINGWTLGLVSIGCRCRSQIVIESVSYKSALINFLLVWKLCLDTFSQRSKKREDADALSFDFQAQTKRMTFCQECPCKIVRPRQRCQKLVSRMSLQECFERVLPRLPHTECLIQNVIPNI